MGLTHDQRFLLRLLVDLRVRDEASMWTDEDLRRARGGAYNADRALAAVFDDYRRSTHAGRDGDWIPFCRVTFRHHEHLGNDDYWLIDLMMEVNYRDSVGGDENFPRRGDGRGDV